MESLIASAGCARVFASGDLFDYRRSNSWNGSSAVQRCILPLYRATQRAEARPRALKEGAAKGLYTTRRCGPIGSNSGGCYKCSAEIGNAFPANAGKE